MNSLVLRSCSLLLALGIAVGCSSTSTSFDWDQRFDFSKLRTWRFADVRPGGSPTDLTIQRVRRSIETVLAQQGHPEVDRSPDFFVAWHVRTEEKATAVADWGYRDPYGAYWTGYYGPRSVDVQYYEEGTLIIDVIDPGENRLVWRGSATRVLDRAMTPERADEIVLEAVRKIFDRFPPS